MVGPVVLCAGTVTLQLVGTITPSAIVGLTIGGTTATLLFACTGVVWRETLVLPRVLLQDFKFGLKAAVAGWASIVNLRLDVLIMSTSVSAAQIGFYGIANNAMLPIATIAAAAAGLLTPAVARLGSDAVAQTTLITREVSRYVRLSMLGAVGLAAVAPFLIPALFGRAFGPAVVLVWILIPGYLARVWAGLITAGAIGMRRTRVGNAIEGCSLVVTVVLLPFLLPRYGAVGAAVTSTVAYLAAGITAAWSLRRLGRGQQDDSFHASPIPTAVLPTSPK
jgi:O-antigen/teichoic acid export membrane protein